MTQTGAFADSHATARPSASRTVTDPCSVTQVVFCGVGVGDFLANTVFVSVGKAVPTIFVGVGRAAGCIQASDAIANTSTAA